jgi:hypothetical protein
MPITFRCVNPECGKSMNAPDTAAGRRAQCPFCKQTQEVPQQSQPGAAGAPGDEDAQAIRRRRIKMGVLGGLLALVLAGVAWQVLRPRPPEPAPQGSSYIGALIGAKNMAERVGCQSNLRSVSTMLKTYAAQYEGRFPPTAEAFARAVGAPRCPAKRDGQPYGYVPGLTERSPPGQVLVHERNTPHDGLGHALLVDGTIASLTWEQLRQAVPDMPASAPAGQ